MYFYINNSKQLITSTLNFNNNLSIDRTTYHKKDFMIPHTFYNNVVIYIYTFLILYIL